MKTMIHTPEEILVYIFQFLDFVTLQKVAILVCKSWFELIRSNQTLSGQLNFKPGLNVSDMNTILEKWTEIKVLQILERVNGVMSFQN